MTHYVVIHAMLMSWYPRRRPSIPTEDILTLGGPLVWFRWLKKPMKLLTWWRNLEAVLGPTIDGLKVLVLLMKMKCSYGVLEPLLRSWNSCMLKMTLYGLWHVMEPMNMPLLVEEALEEAHLEDEEALIALGHSLAYGMMASWWCGSHPCLWWPKSFVD